MMLCDDSVMTLALRQKAKFEYRDFQRQKSDTQKHRKRVQEVKSSIPSAQITKIQKIQERPQTAVKS